MDHYGFFKDEFDAMWLAQGKGYPVCHRRNRTSPKVVVKARHPCPHNYDPQPHDILVPDDPYLKALLPRYETTALCLSDEDVDHDEIYSILGHLPVSMVRETKLTLKKHYGLTNLEPLVLTDIKLSDTDIVRDHINTRNFRPITMIVPSQMPVPKLNRQDFADYDWEKIRNRIVWEYLYNANERTPSVSN